MQITREQFLAFEEVRKSGVTSMFSITVVEVLSGLTKEQQGTIWRNYEELCAKYLEGGVDEESA